MKKLISLCLAFSMITLNALVCVAQDDPCKQLRAEIDRLETMSIEKMKPAVVQMYKESLHKRYKELDDCLKRRLAGATGASADALRAELATLADKILIVEIALQRGEVTTPNTNPGPRPPVIASAQPLDSPAATMSAASVSAVTENGNGSNGNGTSAEGTHAGNGNGTSLPSSAQPPAATPPTPVALQDADPCKDFIASEAYNDPPPILVDIVNRQAFDVVKDNDPDFAVASLSQMVLYTIFDAASDNSAKMLRELEQYQYLSETARTDKQLGPSPSSDGAVSAIEKPSFAQLLGFAIEHGGITKQNDGTNLTLSTSLYSLYAMTGGDTAKRYQEAGFLNRIGVAATFAIQDENDELANVRRNNLSEWSAKVRLFGDRSTRSASFQRFWNSRIRPLIRKRLQAIGGAVEGLSKQLGPYDRIERMTRNCLGTKVADRMAQADFSGQTPEQKQAIVAALMLGYLRSNIFNRVREQGGALQLKPEQVGQIENDFLPRLKTALDHLVLADAEVKQEIANLSSGPLATFAFTNFRIPTGSDYSEAKFLFEQDKGLFRPLKLVGNVGLSFYNNPDPLLNQKRLRDFSGALSFEGSSQSPFTEAENASRITYSFVGRYQRLFENRRLPVRTPDIAAFQFVMEIPFIRGFSLPLSATYANGTEEEKKNHFRFNFGMRLDTDKLFEMLRAASNR